MKNARKLLGVTKNASKSEIRNAFRRIARRLHPDVNTDPRAPKAFAAVVAAYRSLMGRAPAAARRSVPKAVPAPFVCPACHEGYTQAGECPRCEVDVHARSAGPVPAPPRNHGVEAMIASLEAPSVEPWITIAPAARVPLMVTALVVCGLAQAGLGLWMLSIMSVGFAAFAMASETHDRIRKPSWAKIR